MRYQAALRPEYDDGSTPSDVGAHDERRRSFCQVLTCGRCTSDRKLRCQRLRHVQGTSKRVQDGLVIEEGVIPGAMATAIPAAAFMADALFGNFLQYGFEQAGSRLLEAQSEGDAILNNPAAMTAMAYSGPAARTQTYLVMSVDDAAGTLALRDDRLRIDWPDAGKSPVIARDNVSSV